MIRVMQDSMISQLLKTSVENTGYYLSDIVGKTFNLYAYEKKDKWGLPTVTFDAEFKENELKMREDMINQAMSMLEKAGFKDIKPMDSIGAPGLGIHEMGTARMGRDPKTSVLNKHNQVHTVKNVYVTDGAAMTSAGCQNPSLTYMALTARAAAHAADEFKKGNL